MSGAREARTRALRQGRVHSGRLRTRRRIATDQPVEPDFAAGRLFISMMWQSGKALDLLRDPRVVVHSVPSNRMNAGGDIKLYGRVVDERDPEVREGFRDAIKARID